MYIVTLNRLYSLICVSHFIYQAIKTIFEAMAVIVSILAAIVRPRKEVDKQG